MSKWTEIRNDFIDESNVEKGIVEMFIDSWLTNNENEEGKVIAKIIATKTNNKNKITVEYMDAVAKTDKYAQEVIREGINKMSNYQWN